MTINQKIEHLLREDVKSRDDDGRLLLAYLHYFGELSEEEKEALKILYPVIQRSPALETMTRERRLLQAENAYLRGERYNARQTREKELRKFYAQK